MEVTVQDMARAREERARRQRELLAAYPGTLLCFTMNIPGPVKLSAAVLRGFAIGRGRLAEAFLRAGTRPRFSEARACFTGCEAYYALDMAPADAKRLACDIEEADDVGRLFDMDVLRPDGTKAERGEIGLPPRRCLLCGAPAALCARSRAHTAAELWEKARSILEEAALDEDCAAAASLACRALLYEVLTTPKPGLVDRSGSGSHDDMDVFTFASSASVLYPYFEKCARIGAEGAGKGAPETFKALRLPGRMAEGAMLRATGGVNTHKGAIFSLGILCAAAGRLGPAGWRADALLGACADLTRGLCERDRAAAAAREDTHGAQAYRRYGAPGVRGEAERGFPAAREAGLPKLREGYAAGLGPDGAGSAALIALMARGGDTNILYRGGTEAQEFVERRAGEILEKESLPSRETAELFGRELTLRHLSPGGSADMLALCFLADFLEKERREREALDREVTIGEGAVSL